VKVARWTVVHWLVVVGAAGEHPVARSGLASGQFDGGAAVHHHVEAGIPSASRGDLVDHP
jgi:hypothetical protein